MPKQYAVLKSKPVLGWSLDLFASHQAIAAVQVVIQPDDRALYDAAVAGVGKVLAPVAGGATRQASVAWNGMRLNFPVSLWRTGVCIDRPS